MLAAARNYWLSTTRPNGSPHCVPVWGVWQDPHLYFPSQRATQKVRNLAHCAEVVVHLESADDVVFFRGAAEPVTQPDEVQRIDAALAAKYVVSRTGQPYHLEMDAPYMLYRVRPTVADAWVEAVYDQSASRWSFDANGSPRRL
jgi:hypothetical protein